MKHTNTLQDLHSLLKSLLVFLRPLLQRNGDRTKNIEHCNLHPVWLRTHSVSVAARSRARAMQHGWLRTRKNKKTHNNYCKPGRKNNPPRRVSLFPCIFISFATLRPRVWTRHGLRSIEMGGTGRDSSGEDLIEATHKGILWQIHLPARRLYSHTRAWLYFWVFQLHTIRAFLGAILWKLIEHNRTTTVTT